MVQANDMLHTISTESSLDSFGLMDGIEKYKAMIAVAAVVGS